LIYAQYHDNEMIPISVFGLPAVTIGTRRKALAKTTECPSMAWQSVGHNHPPQPSLAFNLLPGGHSHG
jgi:hypothetical protein